MLEFRRYLLFFYEYFSAHARPVAPYTSDTTFTIEIEQPKGAIHDDDAQDRIT